MRNEKALEQINVVLRYLFTENTDEALVFWQLTDGVPEGAFAGTRALLTLTIQVVWSDGGCERNGYLSLGKGLYSREVSVDFRESGYPSEEKDEPLVFLEGKWVFADQIGKAEEVEEEEEEEVDFGKKRWFKEMSCCGAAGPFYLAENAPCPSCGAI